MKNELETARNLGFEYIPTRKELYEEIEQLRARLEKAVELPCNIGDTVYSVNEEELKLWSSSVTGICLFKVDDKDKICSFKISASYNGFEGLEGAFKYQLTVVRGKQQKEMGYSQRTFLTKSEAEARLKELKEKGE